MDDRPLEDAPTAIARIDAKIADFESTVLARLTRKPTGDVEPAFRPTAKEGTLFLQGQTVSRTTYAGLWAWVQEVGAVYAGGYGAGDGSTTFVLPDLRGRVLLGSGTLGTDTYALGATGGAASRTLSTANMPSHNHTGTAANDTHTHNPENGFMDTSGSHGGHFPGNSVLVPEGSYFGVAIWNSGGSGNGGHSHYFELDNSDDTHSHTLTINNTGSGTAFDNRQPYLAINWAVWL